MQKFLTKIILSTILALIFIPFFPAQAHETNQPHAEENEAVIYYNEACGMCAMYVNTEVQEMLSAHGITNFVKKDYVNDKANRPEMNQVMTNLGVPLPLQSHIMTFVGEKYILGGHVPKHIIDDLFKQENSQKFKRIIVYQDKMHGEIKDYQVWAIPEYADDYVGEIKTYSIDTPVTEYLSYLEQNKKKLLEDSKYKWIKEKSLLPTVLISGFLDGLNPCAFAVLLLFIAFLFSIKRGKADVLKMGIIYISAIYLAYLLIGFGILKAVMFSNAPHFMAKLGSWLVIILGLINIINHFAPKFPIKLGIPHVSKDAIQTWMRKATLPAAFVMGFLVGLCTFPCSGGIYVAIIGLLALKTTYWVGVGYMLVYNLMFIAPLIILLALSSNPYTLIKMGEWQKKHRKAEKLIMGLTMIALGVIIIIFFI
jgi:cytochrome c biogenesis protein CcdA